MFAKTIIDSDAFLDMPQSSQLLYFHLSMRADDDGFVNKPKAIMSFVGAKEDDIRLLIAKKFLIPFENGIVVIKHWRVHNYIRNDRYIKTKYAEEMETLELDENSAYRAKQPKNDIVGIPSCNQVTTQVRLGKVRLGKDSIEIDNISAEPKEKKEKFGEFENVLLLKAEKEKLLERMGDWCFDDYVDRLSIYICEKNKKYASHYATILNWWRKDGQPYKSSPKKRELKDDEVREITEDMSMEEVFG